MRKGFPRPKNNTKNLMEKEALLIESGFFNFFLDKRFTETQTHLLHNSGLDSCFGDYSYRQFYAD